MNNLIFVLITCRSGLCYLIHLKFLLLWWLRAGKKHILKFIHMLCNCSRISVFKKHDDDITIDMTMKMPVWMFEYGISCFLAMLTLAITAILVWQHSIFSLFLLLFFASVGGFSKRAATSWKLRATFDMSHSKLCQIFNDNRNVRSNKRTNK